MNLMDTAQLLGNFGEFFGAIAVVTTLVYLALEVRRSRNATIASSVLAMSELGHRATLADRDSPYMAQLVSKAKSGEVLDEQDLYRVQRTVIATLVRLSVTYTQKEVLGLSLSSGGFESLRSNLATFGDPVRERWASVKAQQSSPEFAEWVEANVPGMTISPPPSVQD